MCPLHLPTSPLRPPLLPLSYQLFSAPHYNPDSGVNKTRRQRVTACNIKTSQHQNVIYVKLSILPPSGSCRSAIGGPLAPSAGRLRGPRHLQRGPRLPWMRGVRVQDGGEGNQRANETSLSVCGLHHPTKKKSKKNVSTRQRNRNCTSVCCMCRHARCGNV